jgi:hypothetical protein
MVICFALDRDAPTACQDINDVIREQLSPDQILMAAAPLGTFEAVYHSHHTPNGEPLQTVHLLLDIRGRPAAAPRR